MGGERVPILFIKIWSEPLEPLYQPKARYKNRPDSKLGSVRHEIAARLKARFSARDSMTRLDLARAGRCRSGLGSPRLGSAQLGWLLGVRLISVLGSGSAWGSVSGLGNQLDARLGSARSLARVQLGVRSEIGSGLATRDLVWLGSEESELSSSHLDRSIARPIWSKLISVR